MRRNRSAEEGEDMRWAVMLLAGLVALGCAHKGAKRGVASGSRGPLKREIEALYRHLKITRWCRPLSHQKGSQCRSAVLKYVCEGTESVLAKLMLGPNVQGDGHLEVVLQDDEDGRVTITIAHVAGGSSFSTRKTHEKLFKYSAGGFSVGEGESEWEDRTLLMAGGESGCSSRIDDPKNKEVVVPELK
jgi:hypothetical protein